MSTSVKVSSTEGGSGDSSNRNAQVPSNRKFATRIQNRATEQQKQNLSKAIREMEYKSPIRKRSSSVSEITPSKGKKKTKTRIMTARTVDDCKKEEEVAMLPVSSEKKEEAARIVCKALLLNAWRRKREKIAELNETIGQQRQQKEQLNMQNDVLQKLRESECKRRDEAVSEVSALKLELATLQKDHQNEKENLEFLLSDRDQTISDLKEQLKMAKYELVTLQSNYEKSLQDLRVERGNLSELHYEYRKLTVKIGQSERDVNEKKETIRELKEEIERTRQQVMIEANMRFNEEKVITNLRSQLSLEKKASARLRDLILSLKEKEEEILNTETEMEELRTVIERLEEDGHKLKMQLEIMKIALKREREKPWWMLTKEMFMRYPLKYLRNIAVAMLPALQ